MDKFEKDLNNVLTDELSKKQGGSIGSLVGRLAGKIMPLIVKHGPKILGALGLAAATGAISGSTQKAVTGKGVSKGTGNYVEYGLMLTDGQKKKLGSGKDSMTLRLTKDQLSGNDRLLLTKTQANKIQKSQQKGVGMDLRLSAAQLSKQGGFIGALLAGLAAPLIMNMIGSGQGEGLQLPGTKRGRGRPKKTTGEGMRLPGT